MKNLNSFFQNQITINGLEKKEWLYKHRYHLFYASNNKKIFLPELVLQKIKMDMQEPHTIIPPELA